MSKLKKEKNIKASSFNVNNDLVNISFQNGNYISKTDRNQTYISLLMSKFNSLFKSELKKTLNI
jgi:hypothetical protein